MAADAPAIDGDVADAVAALERRYEGLKKKTTAVYEAKLVMARNAVKRAERRGDGNVDALRGETRALEARRDAALVDLDDELTRESRKTREEMEAEAREESVRRERAELVVRHLEEERAKAGEAEARRRPAARAREEEEELHEEAEEHRSRSPEGTSPREVGGEDARVEGLSAFGRMKRNLSKQPETRRPVKRVAEVVEEARVKVNMAALAPRPMVETRVESVQSQPPMMDPHDALLNRLTKNKPQREKTSAHVDAQRGMERMRVESNPAPVVPRAFAPEPVKSAHRSDPFEPPRGLSAAVKAIMAEDTNKQTIESAFGMPQSKTNSGATASERRASDDVFAPEPKSDPVPAPPLRAESNPYLLSKRDLRPAPGRRVGSQSTYQTRQKHSTDDPSRRARLTAEVVPHRSAETRVEEPERLALAPSNHHPHPPADSGSDSPTQSLQLKPKIPRALVPDSAFKISEVRNLFSYARHGRYGELKQLIMKGVPLDARDEMGNTSLIIACQNGQGRCVKLLVRSGADTNLQNKRGNTALHFSVHFRFDAVSDFLQRHGAATNIQNQEGQTCYEFVG
tara:strand:+ start:209 stop:1921 length:1713 start_codon:yes stop_codon:yes gene_type:complete